MDTYQPKYTETEEEKTLGDKALFFSNRILKLALFVLLSGWLFYWYFSKDFPKIISLADYQPRVVSRVFVKNQNEFFTIGEFFKERRQVISYEQMPSIVVRAFIAAEDDKFFEHKGISLTAILRATIANFKAGHVVQGGSTITQQVAKSLFLTSERSFIRKIKEAILAHRIEKNLSKEEILFLYLNQIYLGHGAYGIQASAQAYFRKDVDQITLPEAALLAGMPRAPTKYNPIYNAKRAKERQLYVLRRMVENSFILPEQMLEAAATPLKIYRSGNFPKEIAPYYTEHVRRYLVEKYGEKKVYEEGLSIYLPSELRILKSSRKNLEKGLRAVDKKLGYRGPREKIESTEGMTKFLSESEKKLFQNKIKYGFLKPEGVMEYAEAMDQLGVAQPEDYLKENEFYEAIVISVNDKAGYATARIGPAEIRMPMKKMTWAHAFSKKRMRPPTPKIPSQVVRHGDVVLVQIQKYIPDPKSKKQEENPPKWIAALEQEPKVEGALFSVDTKTGYVMAMEGGYRFEKSQFNRAIQAKRQPGSAFKPIIYSAGIERGLTPSSIIVDSPIVYDDDIFGKWKPSNFSEKFYGDTTIFQAFIRSRNIPTIKLVQKIGVSKIIEYARKLGMNGHFNEDLSISLGSATTSLYELVQVFSLFPRYGKKLEPIFITKIVDRDGLILEENFPQTIPKLEQMIQKPFEPLPMNESEKNAITLLSHRGDLKAKDETGEDETGEEKEEAVTPILNLPGRDELEETIGSGEAYTDQVMDPRVAYVMTHLMREVINMGTGVRAKALGRPAAGKTGTTNDYKDAWFMGFTPGLATGVWVGFDDSESLGYTGTGAGAALPIWLGYMKKALKQRAELDFVAPPGIVFATIDPTTGNLVDPRTFQGARTVAFIEGTEPTQFQTQAGAGVVESESEFFKEDFQ